METQTSTELASIKRSFHAKQLEKESELVAEHSLEVLAEFEAFEEWNNQHE